MIPRTGPPALVDARSRRDTVGVEPSPSRRWAPWLGAIIGAAVGLGIGAGSYALLTPLLESASGLLRETQGFAWNLVPLLTLLGAIGGLLLGLRLRRPRR